MPKAPQPRLAVSGAIQDLVHTVSLLTLHLFGEVRLDRSARDSMLAQLREFVEAVEEQEAADVPA